MSAVDHQSLLVHAGQALGTERVCDIVVGVGVECCRQRIVAVVVGRETQVRTEREGSDGVNLPLQIHVARPVVVARVALTGAVGEGTTTGVDKTLAARAIPVVGIAVVPGDATTQLQILVVLVADVQRASLGISLTTVVATSATTTASEVAVVDVVGITHERIAHSTEGLHGRQTDAIALVCAIADVRVSLETTTRTALGDKFQHEVVVAVVNARHLRQVTLLVVGFHLIDNIRRQILHDGIVVARHKVAPVHLELLDILTIDADFTFVINLGTRQCFYQCFDD